MVPEPSGGPVTAAVRDLVETQRLCYVATTDADGHPNLSPKGSLTVLSGHRLAFADMASPNTVANLRRDPRLEINVVDPFRRHGYRIRGVASISREATLLDTVGEGLGHEYPVRAAVVVDVTEVRSVRSPVYLFTAATEDEVHAMWQDVYGYRRDPGARPAGAQ